MQKVWRVLDCGQGGLLGGTADQEDPLRLRADRVGNVYKEQLVSLPAPFRRKASQDPSQYDENEGPTGDYSGVVSSEGVKEVSNQTSDNRRGKMGPVSKEEGCDKPDNAGERPVLSKAYKIGMLDEMVKSYERVLDHCGTFPVNHYDLYNSLLLLAAILRDDCAA